MYYLKSINALIENEKQQNALEILTGRLRECGLSLSYPLQDTEGCLWITDNAQMVRDLCNADKPVLVVLHEENRNQDFSSALYACEDLEELDIDYLDKVYRRCQRIPWEILQTDRCIIRETMTEDVDAFYEIYKEPSITEYMEGLFTDREQEVQYIRDYIEKVYYFYDFGIWTVLEKDTGEIIGRAGITYREGFEEPEIGFVIGKKWQRRGYAEEVCRAILQYGREKLELAQMRAVVHPQNKASLALCRKLGMQNAGEVIISKEVHLSLKTSY